MTKQGIIYIGLVVLLVAVSSTISCLLGFRSGLRAGGMVSSLAETMLVEQHMKDQMSNANCEGVKQALNDYLKILEKYKNRDGSFLSGTTYYGDKMLIHTRLARIAKKEKNLVEAQKHMAIATEACRERGWKDCSEENLVRFSKRLERQNPIACLSDSQD